MSAGDPKMVTPPIVKVGEIGDQPKSDHAESPTRSREQGWARSSRSRSARGLARRRSARRAQNDSTPAKPRLNKTRQYVKASGSRRRARSQATTSDAKNPKRRVSSADGKPGGMHTSVRSKVKTKAGRSPRSGETDMQPSGVATGRKASRFTQSANYRALGKGISAFEPVAFSLGRVHADSEKAWSSLGVSATVSATSTGSTYRALGCSRNGTPNVGFESDQTDAPLIYKSLGRSPLRESNVTRGCSKTGQLDAAPQRRGRGRRVSQRSRSAKRNLARSRKA